MRVLLLAGGLLLSLAGPGLGQDRDADLHTLVERQREDLHPAADPMVLVGREQQGNGFRQRAPALAQGRFGPVQVSSEDLYLRRRALYEFGASYNTPPPRASATSGGAWARGSSSSPRGSGPRAEPSNKPSNEVEEPAHWNGTRWILVLLSVGLSLAVLRRG